MTTSTTAGVLNLSFLSIAEDGPDDFIVGNGQVFINVPGIAVTVINMLDGTRTPDEVREAVLRVEGADVDVVDFVSGLDAAGLLVPPAHQANLWDRIDPRRASWLFSRPASVITLLLVAAGLAVDFLRPALAPVHFLAIVGSGSSFTFILTFALASWVLVFIHEFTHILAARSLGVHAELSFGTRMQFLVAQTNVTGIWQVPVRRRYRVYLAGMRVDLALLSAATCVLPFIHQALAITILRVITMIWLQQIVWQFLFFMRTDVYYAYANFTRAKNLMEDARSYLWSVLRRRGAEAPKATRAYAWFLVFGQLLGIAYCAGCTVPVSVKVVREALHELVYTAGIWGKAEALFGLALLTGVWVLFAYLSLRSLRGRLITSRRARLASGSAG